MKGLEETGVDGMLTSFEAFVVYPDLDLAD
jgi:hypothetical protein